VHPLFTEAIVWIPGRGDLLAGLFCSISFLSFIYYHSTKNKLFFLIHAASFLLALFSKEISVFLPVVLIFYYWFVIKNKYNIKGLAPFLLVWSFSVFAFFFLRYTYLNSKMILSFKAFVINLPMIPIFLSKLVIPLELSSMPTYSILFTMIGLILFVSSGFYILKMKIGYKFLIMLGVIWFLGFIIPAMFVELPIAKVHFDYLECRAYLPSIGIFIALGVFLNEIIKGKGINILRKMLIPLILAFSVMSYSYSENFAEPIVFFSSLIKSNPRNAFAYSERGSINLFKNNLDLALADFDNSIKISPTYSNPSYKKGLLYINMNDHIRAEHFFSVAINYDTLYPEINYPPTAYVYVNLSIEKVNQHQYNEAFTLLKKAAIIDPEDSKIYNNFGIIYFNKAEYDSAVNEYSKAIQLEPNSALYFNNRGRAKYSLRDYFGAYNDFSKAAGLSKDYAEAYFNMGVTKLEMGDNEGAISNLSIAIKLNSNYGAAYYFRGTAYSKINKKVEAKENLDKALSLGYK
jgi:tetratricopeptide (TPR) repeat protein